MIDIENNNDIAILRMNNGPANAMNLEFNLQLAQAVNQAAASSSRAIVLTGQGKIFCAGVDLPRLLEGGAEYVRKFLASLCGVLEVVYFCPKPVIIAVNGHAIAGGCILASASDRTLMAAGKGLMGVPEIHVGIPFPTVGMEIMRSRIHPGYFGEVTQNGKNYSPQEALERGLIDGIEEPEQLMEKALSQAALLASIRPELFSITKQQSRQPVRDATDLGIRRFEASINALWESEETFAVLREFAARTLNR